MRSESVVSPAQRLEWSCCRTTAGWGEVDSHTHSWWMWRSWPQYLQHRVALLCCTRTNKWPCVLNKQLQWKIDLWCCLFGRLATRTEVRDETLREERTRQHITSSVHVAAVDFHQQWWLINGVFASRGESLTAGSTDYCVQLLTEGRTKSFGSRSQVSPNSFISGRTSQVPAEESATSPAVFSPHEEKRQDISTCTVPNYWWTVCVFHKTSNEAMKTCRNRLEGLITQCHGWCVFS